MSATHIIVYNEYDPVGSNQHVITKVGYAQLDDHQITDTIKLADGKIVEGSQLIAMFEGYHVNRMGLHR